VKNNKFHTIRTVPIYNRKIVETKPNWILPTDIDDRSLSWLGTEY
jgi:hypothetical protein